MSSMNAYMSCCPEWNIFLIISFQHQWLQFDHLKLNQLFQVTLESHYVWNTPDTDDIVTLCSSEYTQR